MQNLPDKVARTFTDLREQYQFLIVLRRVNDHFYVYKASSRWDKREKRVKSSQEYLGRITKNGVFIKKMASQKEIELEKARAIIEANGGIVSFVEKPTTLTARKMENARINEIDKKILTFLSMNARAHVPLIAKNVGISISATQYRIKQLEERFGIKYILELNPNKLGYTPYLALIKFEGAIPTLEELNDAVKNEPKIQFAAGVKGEFDVIAYILDYDIVQVIDHFYTFITKTKLGKYGARWNLVPFATAYSFMPTTQAFIETVLNSRVHKRTRENLSLKDQELTEHEFALLKELNKNSVKKFSEIDAQYDFDRGTARYTYHRLVDRGVIVRPTINITNAPVRYIGVITMADIHWETIERNRHRILRDIVEEGNLLNKYSLLCNIGAPWGAIVFVPILNNGMGLDKITEGMDNELGGGSIVKSFIIRNLFVGSLCYRRFDNAYARQYKILVESGKIEPKEIVNYGIQ